MAAEKREVCGFHACQWAMVRAALAAGCDVCDLRGFTPALDAPDPRAGLVPFLAHAGGQAVRYVGEGEPPLRPRIYQALAAL
ncbi:peptidoglycan bridge formation glycyltransferase FemA/FemB family protein [Streptomyces sp. WAC 04229]|uniref:peptidoglycan bridge formation glycyltransferase FemA/FemB family protein n=1 Tax=Streptomyces sp. WAC 04229 TaxID=2203206 RepID=UPI0026A8D8D3